MGGQQATAVAGQLLNIRGRTACHLPCRAAKGAGEPASQPVYKERGIMLNKNLEEIGLDDLQQLVSDGVPEGKTIEYKREFYRLDALDDKDKVKQHEEMLKDISSFANTLGGDLIIGLQDMDGRASNICGFDVPAGVDKLKLRIQQLVQQWLEPRVAMSIHAVDVSPGKSVLVIRIMRSPIGPHRVVYRGKQGPFWARHSSGTFELDTDDLRQAFTNSSSLEEKVKGFRTERIAAISKGDTPVKLTRAPKLVCHLIPSDAFLSRISLTPDELEGQLVNFPLFEFTSGWSRIVNLDGMVVADNLHSGLPAAGYVRVLRNGIIESVADEITTHYSMDSSKTTFFKHDYVKAIISRLPQYLRAYCNLNVTPPISFGLTLLGVKGMNIYYAGFERSPNPVDRDVVEIPAVEIQDLSEADCATLLKPVFDMVWNAAGQSRCLLYDQAGQFRGGF
jgi:hypothetical protein